MVSAVTHVTLSKRPRLRTRIDRGPFEPVSITIVRGSARSEGEVRRDLAAAFRLAHLARRDGMIYTHRSAVVSAEEAHSPLNEFALAFAGVTASNFVKFNLRGKAGFNAVEFIFRYVFNPGEIKRHLDANCLQLVLNNLAAGNRDEVGVACHPDRVGEFREDVCKAIGDPELLGVQQLNCLVGKTLAGVADGVPRRTTVDNLRHAADKLKKAGLRLLIEPVNTSDFPGFYRNRKVQAASLLVKVGADTPASTRWLVTPPASMDKKRGRSSAGALHPDACLGPVHQVPGQPVQQLRALFFRPAGLLGH